MKTRKPHAWELYLAVGVLVTVLYWAVPPFKGSGPVINGLGLSGVVAVIFGVRRNRPASALPWWFFALGLGLFWLGDLYTYSYPKLLHKDVPFPSAGDGIYLTVYPALMAGLLILVRRRNPDRDRAGFIDSAIMTLGLALLSWVGLIAPYVHTHDMSMFARLVSIAYPLGDILLLAVATRLIVDAGKRQPAFYLLVSSIVCLLVTDYVYGLLLLDGTYTHQLWLDVGWIGFYLLWGAAALHPSMRSLEQADLERQRRLTGFRLGLLTCASLIAPTVGIVHELRHGGGVDMIVVMGASVVLFCLVVARMAGLNRQQERSTERERVLSQAGAALVAGTSREDLYAAALQAVGKLAGSGAAVRLVLIEDDTATVVAGGDSQWAIRSGTANELLTASKGADGGHVTLDERVRADLMLPASTGCVLAHALSWDGATRGLIVTADGRRISRTVQSSLQALATHVSLALESAALTDEVLVRTSEARLSSLVKHASDLITVIDENARVLYQSPSIERVLGYDADEVVGMRFDELLAPGEETRLLPLLADDGITGREAEILECSLRHRDGSPRQFEILRTNLLHDETVGGIVLNGRDVSERKAFEEQLAHQAFHDPVTSLANRALFVERARHALARTRRDDEGLAVIFLDLDDFKTINDSLGHAAGDQVLLDVAKRLESCIRASDTAARFGGDEFAVLLEDVESIQEASDAAERILEAFTEPLRLEGKELIVRASLGIAVAGNGGGAEADDLIRNADAAMYIAKRDGKGGYRMFEPAMHEVVLARLEMRADLQRAIVNNEFELHYQPVVRLEDGVVCGLEALVRWQHPERGLLQPDSFIPFAEESGLIVPIGRWVLREGCRKAQQVQEQFPLDPPLTMSINLSVKQLQHSDIVADVSDAMREAGLDPRCLTLEITETVVMADADLAVERLQDLKALGVRLAMDDFGTGYSSLSYLSRFPVDVLKMDRSFLRSGQTPEQSGLASAVVALGQTLALEVVAEGIELKEQWNTLRELGCESGQGFYFARPMEGSDAMAFLADAIEAQGKSPERSPVAVPTDDAP
jgi:diguanylate cyclase (GGDEF)-like protein/PAS domain S-box-containing protein